jgi:hypothetical protein
MCTRLGWSPREPKFVNIAKITPLAASISHSIIGDGQEEGRGYARIVLDATRRVGGQVWGPGGVWSRVDGRSGNSETQHSR